MKKITVVLAINDLLLGGAQQQCIELAKRFDRSRFRLVFVTLFQFPEKTQWYGQLPEDIEIYKFNFRGWWDASSWRALYGLLKTVRPQVVVSHLFFSNMTFRILKPLCRYEAIACEHNTYVSKPLWQKIVDRLLAHGAYRIVAVSNTVAEFTAAQERIPRGKFVVIYNGIDLERVKREIEALPPKEVLLQELSFAPGTRLLLNVARLTGQKNHRLLIEGFAEFSKNHPEYMLGLVGEGYLRAVLEKHAQEKEVGNKVVFFGRRSDVWRFYKAAHAFVATSDIEGLSIAYLEALAAGVPLVCTKTAGTDELIKEGENGFFIHASSARKVAEALQQLHESDIHALQNGATKSANSFSIVDTVAKYETLVAEAASRNSQLRQ